MMFETMIESPLFWVAIAATVIGTLIVCTVRACRKEARWLRENHRVDDPSEVGKTHEFTNGAFRFLVKLTAPIGGQWFEKRVYLSYTGEVTMLYPSDWIEHPRIEAIDQERYQFTASLKDGRMLLGQVSLRVSDKERDIQIVPTYGKVITMRRAEPKDSKEATPVQA